MTGVSIYERTSTQATMVRDGKAKEAKALAQQWWHDNRAKGARTTD